MEHEIHDTNQIMQGQLIVGNHDSLLIYGNAVQVGLNDFSKSIFNIITRNNDSLEDAINDVSDEIEKSQKVLQRENNMNIFLTEKRRYIDIVRRYNVILGCIEKMEVSFKLQQAQLVKDNKILDLLEGKLKTSICNIEKLISNGNKVLSNRGRKEHVKESVGDIDSWYNRLEKKIEDLEVSLVIANQSIVQVRMMKENNYLMIDRIISILATTIPLWRNQVSSILGIARIHKDNQIQSALMDIANKQIEKSQKLFSKSLRKRTKLNYEELQKLNYKLQEAIDEIIDIDKQDINIKKEFTKSLKL